MPQADKTRTYRRLRRVRVSVLPPTEASTRNAMQRPVLAPTPGTPARLQPHGPASTRVQPRHQSLQRPHRPLLQSASRQPPQLQQRAARLGSAGPVRAYSYQCTTDEEEMCEVHHVHKRVPLRSVALGDGGTFVISYEDGRLGWSGGLSDALHAVLLRTRKYKRGLSNISLGRNEGSDSYAAADDPGEVWFARRNTGITYLGESASAGLRDKWDEGEGDDFITHVSFAPSRGYFVLKEGGGASWSGLPSSLETTLDESWEAEGGMESLSVGHNGEWVVRFARRVWWNGVHPTLAKLLQERGDVTGALEWTELGPDGTFVALFERYTVWYGPESLTDQLLACM